MLAAGLSQRMGRFKPLLPFGNQTVIEHTIQYFRTAGVQTIVVVIGHQGDQIRRVLQNQAILYALNSNPESPMGTSVRMGAEVLPVETKAILITPVDHPAVSAEIVSELIEQWRAGSRLVIPTWQERGGHPVLIDGSFRDELLRLPEEGGLRSFLAMHKQEERRVPVSSAYVVRDMDTWDDYVHLHRDFFGFPPETVERQT